VSHLINGHFSWFTTDKLLDFLKRLDRKVTIEVSRHRKGEPYRQVTFAPQERLGRGIIRSSAGRDCGNRDNQATKWGGNLEGSD
jgi:hypothetical protein